MKSNTYNNMKTIFVLFIMSLFINGVFAGDAHEVKSVLVRKGESVILPIDVYHTDTTFVEDITEHNTVSYSPSNLHSDKRCTPHFHLSIVNITTNNSVLYQLYYIIKKNMTKPLSVYVYVDILSVIEGVSVTLHSNLTELQSKDVLIWRFKDCRIARINRAANNSDPVYEPDVICTDRLKMNNQTGDLTITYITSEQTGIYQLEIISKNQTIKVFRVDVSQRSSTGLSSGGTAGICVFLLVLVIAAAGLIFYRHKHQGGDGGVGGVGGDRAINMSPLIN